MEHRMSRGFPSMTALLALLAIAGYQNRDKISEWLNAAQRKADDLGSPPEGGATGGPPGKLGGVLRGTSVGDMLGNGLRDLLDRFKEAGHGEVADSWVGRGPNKQIATSHLERVISSDVLDAVSQQTGLSREEILSRLSKNLPEAVDKYTPEGRLPTAAELSRP
jgi:uncharacterized protein YidB (DUF937 family)